MTESEERDPDSQEGRTPGEGEQGEAGTEDDRSDAESEGKSGEAAGGSQGVPELPVEPPTHEEA